MQIRLVTSAGLIAARMLKVDPTHPWEVGMCVLEAAKRAGKIRHYGVSNFPAAKLARCLEWGHPVCDQIGYHIFDRRPEHEVFPFARQHGIGIMAYGSIAHGLLTGTWSAGQAFADGDWRRSGHHFALTTWTPSNLSKNLAVIEKLKRRAAQYEKSVAVRSKRSQSLSSNELGWRRAG